MSPYSYHLWLYATECETMSLLANHCAAADSDPWPSPVIGKLLVFYSWQILTAISIDHTAGSHQYDPSIDSYLQSSLDITDCLRVSQTRTNNGEISIPASSCRSCCHYDLSEPSLRQHCKFLFSITWFIADDSLLMELDINPRSPMKPSIFWGSHQSSPIQPYGLNTYLETRNRSPSASPLAKRGMPNFSCHQPRNQCTRVPVLKRVPWSWRRVGYTLDRCAVALICAVFCSFRVLQIFCLCTVGCVAQLIVSGLEEGQEKQLSLWVVDDSNNTVLSVCLSILEAAAGSGWGHKPGDLALVVYQNVSTLVTCLWPPLYSVLSQIKMVSWAR